MQHLFFKICHWNSGIEQSTIYLRHTVAIFPPSEKLLTTTHNLKKLVRQALMSRCTSSRRTGEVDTAVAVRDQEEVEGRYKIRKQEERKKKDN